VLYKERIVVYSEIHTKHINTLCGQNVEFASIKPGGTCSDHRALKAEFKEVCINLLQITVPLYA
jgi:hypothetical protein